MIANNTSPDYRKNSKFKRDLAKKGEGNKTWLKRVIAENGYAEQGLILIGGNSIPHFHIRVAQSYLRHDISPSYWSLVGILIDEETFYTVPLQWCDDLGEMPRQNAIQKCKISDFNDPIHFPNIAYVQFTDDHTQILKIARRLKLQRSSVIDLVELVISWLEFVWGVRQKCNPLYQNEGLPSAVYAEAVYGICGIELTPGLETSSSCPESIWQAAKWWSSFYKESSQIASISSQAQTIVPKGSFMIRQSAAAIYEKPYTTRKQTTRSKSKKTTKTK